MTDTPSIPLNESPAPPQLIVTMLAAGQIQLACNVKGDLMRPMALWLLEQAKLLLLSQPTDQQRLVPTKQDLSGLRRFLNGRS